MTFSESMNNPEINPNKTEILPARVYLIESPTDKTVLYGLDIRISKETITWFDGTKDRVMYLKTITDNDPNHFSFQIEGENGHNVYTLTPLSLETYNKFVKNHLVNPPEFHDEENMLSALENTKNSAW